MKIPIFIYIAGIVLYALRVAYHKNLMQTLVKDIEDKPGGQQGAIRLATGIVLVAFSIFWPISIGNELRIRWRRSIHRNKILDKLKGKKDEQ